METIEERIAQTIRQKMKRQKMSVNKLAEKTGISYNVLKGRLNTGLHLEIVELRLIAIALGATTSELTREAEHQPTEAAA